MLMMGYGLDATAQEVTPKFFGTEEQRKRWLKLRYVKMPLFLRPFANFTYRYFFKLGFLDGKEGFVWHVLQGFWYRFLVDACISGASAFVVARRMILGEMCKRVVIVGCDLLCEFISSGFASFKSLSPSPCRPYDAARDGLNLGEACAAVLMTSLRSELGENPVVMEGGFISDDANHISGPSRTGEELAIAKDKDDTAHGTITFEKVQKFLQGLNIGDGNNYRIDGNGNAILSSVLVNLLKSLDFNESELSGFAYGPISFPET